MCGPHRRFAPLLSRTLRRIPQAVGVVATLKSMFVLAKQNLSSFNTASGKYCYFITFVLPSLRSGTCDVWTSSSLCSSAVSHSAAHTVNGRCCCNLMMVWHITIMSGCFNTASGRCCCNAKTKLMVCDIEPGFQYRKR